MNVQKVEAFDIVKLGSELIAIVAKYQDKAEISLTVLKLPIKAGLNKSFVFIG